jgi:outer membrane protein OmpA-like peptidoglycan-associated protein
MKKILFFLMLLPIYSFATNDTVMVTDTVKTNVVNVQYPQYSFWSNWELGINGGFVIPFALETRERVSYVFGLSLYKELNNIWTAQFNGRVNNVAETVGYYGSLNMGLQLSLNDLINGYNPERKSKIYLNGVVGMGVDKSGYLADRYGKFYYEAAAGIGVYCKLNNFTIRVEDNIVLPADLGDGFTKYKSYYNCFTIGLGYHFGVTKVDKIRLEEKNMIIEKGLEYDEIVNQMEQVKIERDCYKMIADTLPQYIGGVINGMLQDTIEDLVKKTEAFDSLNAMLQSIFDNQINFYAIPYSVRFAINSYKINNDGKKIIKEVAAVMKQDTTIRYMVYGFCDKTGSMEFNKKLSMKRAEAVANLLMKYGVKEEQLIIDGFGDEKPFNDGKSDINRRVSFYRVIE